MVTCPIRQSRFSLLEVVVAMLILTIGLLPLLEMQLNSLRLWNRAQHRTTATMIANARLAEALCAERIEEGSTSGQEKDPDRAIVYRWTVAISDFELPSIEDQEVGGLKRVTVVVSWLDGSTPKHLRLMTYAAARQ